MVGGEEGGGRLLLSYSLINDFFQNSISLFRCRDLQMTLLSIGKRLQNSYCINNNHRVEITFCTQEPEGT